MIGSGGERRQPGRKPHEEEADKAVAKTGRRLALTEKAGHQGTAEDQQGQVDEAHRFQHASQHQVGDPGVGIAEVDELHEERDVEQDRLGIGEAQGEGLGKIALTGIHLGRRSRLFGDEVRVQDLHPQIKQVDRAQIAHQGKQQWGGANEGRDPQIGAENEDGIADEDAEGGAITRAYAAHGTGSQHVEGVRARGDDDEEETDQIGPDVDDTQAFEHVPSMAGDGPDNGGRPSILIRPAPSTRSDQPSTRRQHERPARHANAIREFAHFGYVQIRRDRAW